LPESLTRHALDRVSPNRAADDFFADHQPKPRRTFLPCSLSAIVKQKIFAAQNLPKTEYGGILVCPKQAA